MRRIFAIVIACVLAGAMQAQDAISGAVHGQVRDASGAVVAGAAVELRRGDEASVVRVLTDARGEFFLQQLPPETYTVQFAAAGFEPRTLASVTVALGETTELNTELSPATVTSTVTVRADEFALVASLQSTPLAQTIAPIEVADLPIDGRRWQDLALLTPAVSADDEEEQQLSFRAISPVQNLYALDGFNDTQNFRGEPRGGARMSLRVPQSAVREFRVQNDASAINVRHGAGGVITAITHGGPDRRAGSAFLQYRSNIFAATDPAARVTRYNNGAPTMYFARPQDIRLQWGATSGGALFARRGIFYHLAYEQQRRGFPAVASPESQSFYSLSATQTALLQTRGVTLPQIGNALTYLESLTGTVARRADEITLLPRVDWHGVSLIAHLARSSAPAGVRTQTVVNRGASSFGDDTVSTDALLARWTHSFSSHVINSLGAGISRDLQRQQAQPSLPQEPHSGPNGFSPEVNIGSDFSFGKPATLGRRRYPDERRLQLTDTVSLTRGTSQLQAGASVSIVSEHISTLQNEEGTYNYIDSTTPGRAGALVDWITDQTFSATAYPNGACPSIYAATHLFCFRSYTQSFGASDTNFTTSEWSAFAQYHAHPLPNVSIEAGLRYELLTLPDAQRPNAALDAIFGATAVTSSLPQDRNNVAPRAAIAWAPGRRRTTVVRASYGVFYGRIPGATVWSALSRTGLPQSTQSIRLTAQTIIDAGCASTGTNFGYPATYACAPQNAAVRTASAMMFSRDFRAPMVQQAQISVEHQMFGLLLGATYLASSARQLPNSTDINIAPSVQSATFRVQRTAGGAPGVRNGDTFTVALYTARISSAFGPVTAIVSNASASQHSLTITARRPLRNGISLRASWTYGKTLDFGQNHSALPETNGQLDPYDVHFDRAASDLDRRHRVVASGTIQPTFHGGELTRRIANGWSAAPIFSASSGRPFSYLITGGTALNGGADSINGAGGLRYLPSVGRNTQRLPWTANLNLRLARAVRLSDALKGRIYADVFNTLNHGNQTRVQQRAFLVGTPSAGVTPLLYQDAPTIAAEGLTTQQFGTLTGSGTTLARQREVQFGLRVEW